MGNKEKPLKRFPARPKDYTYEELRRFLQGLGYREDALGKTSGSRVAFYYESIRHIIRLHKPHPGNELKLYQIDLIREELEGRGMT